MLIQRPSPAEVDRRYLCLPLQQLATESALAARLEAEPALPAEEAAAAAIAPVHPRGARLVARQRWGP
jgi:hypothetical protein